MHHLRLALIAAALCGASYGCATPDQPAAQGAAAAPADARNGGGSYRTGSRLPPLDSDGSSSTGAQSKEDYEDMRRGAVSPSQR